MQPYAQGAGIVRRTSAMFFAGDRESCRSREYERARWALGHVREEYVYHSRGLRLSTHCACPVASKTGALVTQSAIVASGATGPMGVTGRKPVSLTSLPSLPMQTSEIVLFYNAPNLSVPEARVSEVSGLLLLRPPRHTLFEGLSWMPGCEAADVHRMSRDSRLLSSSAAL